MLWSSYAADMPLFLLLAGGFLTDHFPSATKAIWDFEGDLLIHFRIHVRFVPCVSLQLAPSALIGCPPMPCLAAGIYASSRHIPGVRFAGLIHPGTPDIYS